MDKQERKSREGRAVSLPMHQISPIALTSPSCFKHSVFQFFNQWKKTIDFIKLEVYFQTKPHMILCNDQMESSKQLLSGKVKEHPTTGRATGFCS